MKRILFSLLAITLLSGCEFNLGDNEKKPIEDNEKIPVEANKITELSLTSTEVKTIEETFIERFFSVYDSYGEYRNQKVNDKRKGNITINFVNNLIKKNNQCNPGYDEDGYRDTCNYVTYDDFNNAYFTLFGETSPKADLYYQGSLLLKYDSNLKVYKLIEIDSGGGDGIDAIFKLIKAEQDNERIYIYQKVVFVGENIYSGTSDGGYNIKFPHADEQESEGTFILSPKSITEFKEELTEKYLDKFDTYKWTFKKNSNGTYMYEKLEYVEK